MTSTNRHSVAVLAAGRSTRFPGDKLLYPLDGRPLAAHIADTIATLDVAFRFAVCPPPPSEREGLFSARGFEIIANAVPELGMASSLALAAERATVLGADSLLICLADMPFVSIGHLEKLLAQVGDDPVATAIDGHGGPPAVFPRRLFPALAALEGDRGARQLLHDAELIDAPRAELKDFDTVEDLR